MSIVVREALIPLMVKSKVEYQASATIADITKKYHTGLSRYASAESEVDSDASIGIQQMSLGPSGSTHLHERSKVIRAEPRSAAIRATGDDAAALQGHLLSYIDNAMEQFEQKQRSQVCQSIYPSQAIKMPRARETYFLDAEMESVESRQGQSDFGDPRGHTPY